MQVPAECPVCEEEGRRSRHWVESENYAPWATLPIETLCPACTEQRKAAVAKAHQELQDAPSFGVMTRNN